LRYIFLTDFQPKYWCKHCKTYIRDTKLEKTNHEATPKHQGNLKRFLRDLHRGHEKDEKDKERAKSEVARLNGLVSGGGLGSASSSSSSGLGRGPTPSIPKPQATPAQRKQQLAQLAEMGISIPDEFRPDMAMAGEWQVTSERIIEPEDGEKKPDALALGVRKRVLDEDELEAAEAKKRRWGSTYKSHPTEEDSGDLDALLGHVTRKGKEPAVKTEATEEVKGDIRGKPADAELVITQGLDEQKSLGIKREPSDEEPSISPLDSGPKEEGEEPALPGIVFKKRKAKNIRQK
jgi:U1 zinc finger